MTPPAATGPVTCLSVVGCSGHPVLRKVLKALVPERYVASVPDGDGGRIKLAGHLHPTPANVSLLAAHDVGAALVFRDPRDNFVNLVHRSRYDWCPDKFTRPRTHEDAMAFHRLVKAAGERGGAPFVRFYAETVGAKGVLEAIFGVTAWKDQPNVHAVRFEDLVGLRDVDPAVPQRAIVDLARFVGASPDGEEVETIATRCRRWLGSKLQQQPGFMVGWRDVFTPEDEVAFAEHFGPLLADLGYEEEVGR